MITLIKKLFFKIHLNKRSNISNEQYNKIAIGALYSEQQGAFINSLTSGINKSKLQKLLSSWWGINNEIEAIESLDYLLKKGFRYYFESVIEAYLAKENQQKEAIIAKGLDNTVKEYEEDVEKAFSQLYNLTDTFEELSKNGIITNVNDLRKIGNLGWDCGRMVFLARVCFDAGYISEAKAWHYINEAYKLAIEKFSNWEGFSKSYILGRGMWGGTGCYNEGIMDIAKYLLKEEKSPWVQMKFK